MGLIANIKNWVKRISPQPAVRAVTNYTYQSISYALQQARALPTVVNAMVHDEPTQTMARYLLRITGEDLLPLLLVTCSNQLIQNYGEAYLQEEPADQPWLSVNTAIEASLHLLQMATWIYSVRKQTQILVRTTLATLKAPPLLKEARVLPHSNICTEEGCTMLRFAQGTARDIIAFYATGAAIWFIRYIPFVGDTVAAFFTVYLNGRYVITLAFPEVCNRHHAIYLRTHSSLAFSLGVVHLSNAWFVNAALEMTTGIPQAYYAETIKTLLLLVQLCITVKLNLPKPQKEAQYSYSDPVMLYQSLIGFIFDVIALGLKEKIPRMLKNKDPDRLKKLIKNMPWESTYQCLIFIHNNRFTRIFLPKLLHSIDNFLEDPIIASDAKKLRTSIIDVLKTIEELSQYRAIRLASMAPEVASQLVHSLCGTPRFINLTVLNLLTDKEVINYIKDCRIQFELEDIFQQEDDKDDKTMVVVSTKNSHATQDSSSTPSQTLQHRFCGGHSSKKKSEDEWVLVNYRMSPS